MNVLSNLEDSRDTRVQSSIKNTWKQWLKAFLKLEKTKTKSKMDYFHQHIYPFRLERKLEAKRRK